MHHPEAELHIAIVGLLRLSGDPNWFWFHPPNGGLRTKATAALLQCMGVRPGVPDLILINPARLVHGLEFKRPGGRLSEAQREFEQWCHKFARVDSVDAAVEVLKEWGVLKSNVRIAA